ncbi:MAG: helix-turn-helix domain-containing protein [Candidatus Krumholzibacteriota bacterium]|nr:helix-turn-helix domain-containing protein [Candidatus Krumholzibacteriota bacterium]
MTFRGIDNNNDAGRIGPAISRQSARPRKGRFFTTGAGAALLSLFLVLTASTTLAATDPAGIVINSWNADSGLPHNEITALAQSADGYIWIGTPAGLVRFDGAGFTLFDRWKVPLLVENRISSICAASDSSLWVGTGGGGIYFIKNGEWKRYGLAEGLRSEHVSCVAEGSGGEIWFGTEIGLHRLSGGDLAVFGLNEGLADDIITAIDEDQEGRLWAGTMRGGLVSIDRGGARRYGYYEGLADPGILSVLALPGGEVRAGTMNGIFSLRPGENHFYRIDAVDGIPVTVMTGGEDGEVLAGTMVEGLKVLGAAGCRDLFVDNGLASSHVTAVLRGRGGVIWAGTKSDGLISLGKKRAGSITSKNGLPEGRVYAVTGDGAGVLWVATENRGVWRIEEGEATGYLDGKSGLAGNIVRALMIDRSGRFWVGTLDAGLTIITGDRSPGPGSAPARTMQYIGTREGLLSERVTSLLQDRTGTVWVGTDAGLNYFSSGVIGRPGSAEALKGQNIQVLYEDAEGTVFAGTRNGIWRLSGAVFQKEAPEKGAGRIDAISLLEDHRGRLWAGTNGDGIRLLSEDTIAGCRSRDGLPGDFIYSISAADSGKLWISCENGVFSVFADSLADCVTGRGRFPSSFLLDDTDGMPSSRCSGLCSPAVFEGAGGIFYYPTSGGLAVIDGAIETRRGGGPDLLIESIIADGAEISHGSGPGPIVLPGGTKRIEIRFTAFDYADPGKLRFLYRLGGVDGDRKIVMPGEPRSAVYNDLRPGRYSFDLWVIGNGGKYGKIESPVDFEIEAPIYRRSSFIMISISVLLTAAALVYVDLQRRKRKKQRLKYSTSSINPERMDAALDRLVILMEEESIYLDPDLTLKKLAQRLGIHYNHLSRIINERFSVSFSNYINRYRIEEAKKRLVSEEYRNRNITEIIYDTGFYSKSTFNTAFRKFTGMSPSEYKKKNI